MFERLILHRINTIEKEEAAAGYCLSGRHLTGSSQHGFKKNRSTETACMEIQSELATHCDENKYAVVSSIDMTAAFDVVNHKLLIKRLTIMGLPKKFDTSDTMLARRKKDVCGSKWQSLSLARN